MWSNLNNSQRQGGMAYYSTAPSYASRKHLSAFQLQSRILRICLFKLEEFGAPGSL